MIHGSVRDAVITLPGVGWDKAVEPTTGIEPVNLFLTKEVLYLLSYVGPRESGEDTGARATRDAAMQVFSLELSIRRVEIPTLGGARHISERV